MLGIDSVIISPETIFYDAAGTNIEFIYFPGTNKEFIGGKAEKQIKNLLIICLKSSIHNDKDHFDGCLTRFIRRLCRIIIKYVK